VEELLMSEEEILIALKEIHARYCIPASEQNYTDKDYACMQYEKLVIHLQKEIERLNNIIKEVREYIENNDLYEQDYDYDYEENLVVGPPSDETARKILLGILDKGVD